MKDHNEYIQQYFFTSGDLGIRAVKKEDQGKNWEEFGIPIKDFIKQALTQRDEEWVQLQKEVSDIIVYPNGHVSTNFERIKKRDYSFISSKGTSEDDVQYPDPFTPQEKVGNQ